MEPDCRRDEGHAVCTFCELGGLISGSLDSSVATSKKGMMLSYNLTNRVLLSAFGQLLLFSML